MPTASRGRRAQARIQSQDVLRAGWNCLITGHNPKSLTKLHGFETVQPDPLPLLIVKFSKIDQSRPINTRHQAENLSQLMRGCFTTK